nr:MAG TPA: tail protein [Caudoviricetes sp.]
MAICLLKKNGGGVQSEEVTALSSEVLAGKTALTADSNDEPIRGTMPLLDRNGFDVANMRLAHQRADGKGQGFVVDSPAHGRGIALSVKPPDGKKYALDNNIELVFKPEPDLRAENVRGDKNIAGVQGGIPIWNPARSGYSDMLYAWNNEGHYVDHPVAGRGVVLKIGNGYLIENANWVFLAEADLIGPNIRAGVNMFGVQGELVDYGTGRAAFYNATFDGALLSGVASADRLIRLGEVYANGNLSFGQAKTFVSYSEKVNYLGIRDGGLRFSLTAQADTGWSNNPLAVFFTHSVNLTPFRKIKIGAKILSGSYQKRNNRNDLSEIQFGIVAVSKKNVSKRVYPDLYNYVVDLNNSYKGVHASFVDGAQDDKGRESGRFTGQQLWAEVDVSGINEQCFMLAYAGGTSFYPLSAEVVINHIEFIN